MEFDVSELTGRLIPAYAGRTHVAHPGCLGRRAHPRLRGADKPHGAPLVAHDGSSPLTRGGLFTTAFNLLKSGLIPAYAGRTRLLSVSLIALGAHPRLRGAD